MEEISVFEESTRRFIHPRGEDGRVLHYLCGNSLGLQPVSCREYLNEVLNDWAGMAVDAHSEAKNRWLNYPDLLSPSLAALCGARSHEVRAMGSLSSNLHLMMVSFFRPKGRRCKILMEAGAFPSDQYAVESQMKFHGLNPEDHVLELRPREGEFSLHTEDILSAIQQNADELALVLFSGVQYISGQVFDMHAISQAARRAGACVGFDLAHAIGNIPLQLHDWDPDFAVWCSYKYLNAGPGATAGIFVNDRHATNPSLPRFTGWFGNEAESRFLMKKGFMPAYGAEGWQLSNENILSLAALRASLAEFDRVDFSLLMKRQRQLVEMMEIVLQKHPDIQILTPEARGGQLSFRLINGNSKTLFDFLHANGIIGDFRQPDVIRLAIAPLYNREEDVHALEATLCAYFA